MKIIMPFILIIFFFGSMCYAEGLDNLIELARSQGEIQKQYADETRAFEKVKKSIEAGAIAKGQTKAYIKERYGEPVVSVKDMDGKRIVEISAMPEALMKPPSIRLPRMPAPSRKKLRPTR